jgi:hypothetical protein
VLDGETDADGRRLGRAVAQSTFHHFADYNWDIDCGAPSFVSEPPGSQIKDDPSRLEVFRDYVRNLADWLHPLQPRACVSAHDTPSNLDSLRTLAPS